MADAQYNYAAAANAADPGMGQGNWEAQFFGDEAAADQANNASGILSGFKMPSDMSPGDLQQLVTTMETFGNNVGWKYVPNPQQAIQAWKAGATDYASAAKLWGQKLPPQLGWVKHGYTKQQFSQYKEDNREQILARYGAHGDSKDENFVHNLDNPLVSFGAQGGSIGQAPQQIDTTGAGKSAVR